LAIPRRIYGEPGDSVLPPLFPWPTWPGPRNRKAFAFRRYILATLPGIVHVRGGKRCSSSPVLSPGVQTTPVPRLRRKPRSGTNTRAHSTRHTVPSGPRHIARARHAPVPTAAATERRSTGACRSLAAIDCENERVGLASCEPWVCRRGRNLPASPVAFFTKTPTQTDGPFALNHSRASALDVGTIYDPILFRQLDLKKSRWIPSQKFPAHVVLLSAPAMLRAVRRPPKHMFSTRGMPGICICSNALRQGILRATLLEPAGKPQSVLG
jgi:hypothetical protein